MARCGGEMRYFERPVGSRDWGEPVMVRVGQSIYTPAMVEHKTEFLTLLAKPQRRRALGDAGRAHVKRTFSWADAADQFTALFESVIPSEVAA